MLPVSVRRGQRDICGRYTVVMYGTLLRVEPNRTETRLAVDNDEYQYVVSHV